MVVHDSPFAGTSAVALLGSSHLALHEVRLPSGKTVNYLHRIDDIVEYFASNTPEQLLDVTKLPNLVVVHAAAGGAGTPIGLALATALAGLYRGLRLPLGVQLYGSELRQWARSPFSEAVFRMFGSLREGEAVTRDQANRHLEAAGAYRYPSSASDLALQSFRRTFLDCLSTTVFPDGDSFLVAANQLWRQVDRNKQPRNPDLAVQWLNSAGQEETVLMRSLFADCLRGDEWQRDLILRHDVLGFCDRVNQKDARGERVVEPVATALATALRNNEPLRMKWRDGMAGYQLKTLALLLCWAVNRCQARRQPSARLRSGDLVLALGLPSHDKNVPANRKSANAMMTLALTRYLPEELGGRATAEKLIQLLDEARAWPFRNQSPLRDLLERGLDWTARKLRRAREEALANELGREHWPDALRVLAAGEAS